MDSGGGRDRGEQEGDQIAPQRDGAVPSGHLRSKSDNMNPTCDLPHTL